MSQRLLGFFSEDFSTEDVDQLRAIIKSIARERLWSWGPPHFVDRAEPDRTVGVLLTVAAPGETPPTPVEEPVRVLELLADFSKRRGVDFELELDQTSVGSIHDGELAPGMREALLDTREPRAARPDARRRSRPARGRQLRFCATPSDAEALAQRLQALEPMLILHSRSLSRVPRVVPSLDLTEAGARWLSFFLVRVEDLASVVTQHVPTQEYWTIDELHSPVMECQQTYVGPRIMRPGRLHYLDGYFGLADEWIDKPPPFLHWAKAVLMTAREALAKYDGEYVGAEAREWLQRDEGVVER